MPGAASRSVSSSGAGWEDWAFFRFAAPWLVAPLTLFLIWRIFGRQMSRRDPPLRESIDWPGADSEFFVLERRLARAGFTRSNGETTAEWLRRVSVDIPAVADLLNTAVRLHHRYRFGGEPLEESERARLKTAVQACLSRINT
jgi:hypothetical protein